MGWYESGAKPAAQRKKDKEREDGALISSFESLDSALPEAVVSMSGLFLGVPLGVGFLSFLTRSFLPDTTSSSGLRVSRWPRLTERAQFVLDPGVCKPEAELMSRVVAGRLRREKEWEEAPSAGLPGGTGWGRAGSGGPGEFTWHCCGCHTLASRLSREPAAMGGGGGCQRGQAGGEQGAAGQGNSPRTAVGIIHLPLVSPGSLQQSEVSAPTLST